MNFIFMIILILLILILFNIYIQNIHVYFYTFILLFLLLGNELYFYKIEKFNSDNKFEYDADFKNNLNKHLCFWSSQKELIENPNSNKLSNCYKINNIDECENNPKCNYNFEHNKCLTNYNNCDKINDESLKCYYMDNENDCTNISENRKYCPKLNESECKNSSGNCRWDKTECTYLKDSCISNTKKNCKQNNKCNWNEYSDIYNIENDTNIGQCYDFKLLNDIIKSNNFLNPIKITDINTIDDLYAILDDSQYDKIRYYGIMKENNKLIAYLFQDNIDYLDSASILLYKCLDKNKYLGSNSNIIIYKRNGKCTEKNKCDWKYTKNTICQLTSDKEICLKNDCHYDKNTNKCSEKGTCHKKCNTHTKDECDKVKDFNNNSLCKWEHERQTCNNI
jgi:hypothetical protein